MIDKLIDRKRRLIVEKDRLAVKLRIIESEYQDTKIDCQNTRSIIKIPGSRIYRVIRVENTIADRG